MEEFYPGCWKDFRPPADTCVSFERACSLTYTQSFHEHIDSQMGKNLHARMGVPNVIALEINSLEINSSKDIINTLLSMAKEWHAHFGLRVAAQQSPSSRP